MYLIVFIVIFKRQAKRHYVKFFYILPIFFLKTICDPVNFVEVLGQPEF